MTVILPPFPHFWAGMDQMDLSVCLFSQPHLRAGLGQLSRDSHAACPCVSQAVSLGPGPHARDQNSHLPQVSALHGSGHQAGSTDHLKLLPGEAGCPVQGGGRACCRAEAA